MASVERVTITIPDELLREIDRRESNRSRFVTEAVRNELDRRRRLELRQSLENPHPECSSLAGESLAEWSRALPAEDTESLLARQAGTPVRWVPGKGWESPS